MEGVLDYTCMPTPPLDQHANISRIKLYVKCSRPLAIQARIVALHKSTKRGLGLVLVRRPQLSHLDTPTPSHHHYHIASQLARTNFQSVHGQTLW